MSVEDKKRSWKNIPELAALAEAFLFAEGEPLPVRKLKQILECSDADFDSAMNELARKRAGSGIALVRTADEVSLAVSALCAPAIRAENERGRSGVYEPLLSLEVYEDALMSKRAPNEPPGKGVYLPDVINVKKSLHEAKARKNHQSRVIY